MATVFLSYRHESDDHRASVRNLAERLEQAGAEVVLDQFAQDREFNGGGPPEGWPQWSTAQAGKADHKILIVGTAAWFKVFSRTEVPGTGLGAAAEAGVIFQRLYNAGFVTGDIRLVSLAALDPAMVPLELQRYHRFSDPADFRDLMRWLTGGPVDPSPTIDDWPAEAPPFSWVMADHDAARAAFNELARRQPPFRYLPIKGVSGTGKSHISLQFLGNALRCTGLACGRFDFKGVADADGELQRFVQNLEIAVPATATTLARQLDAVLNALIARKRPALLIFDTFEAAAPLDRWVTDTLLVALIRQKWLRVVITGQRVPEPAGGAPWSNEASRAIVLTLPEPLQWFHFAVGFKPDLTLEKVQTAHELARGNSALLYQLLGPEA
jgi:hypothetical protein